MKQGDRIQNGHKHNFFMIPNEMIDSHIENMTPLGYVVYSVLMRHADLGSSQCFPSYSTLMKKSTLSRPTIAKCIEHLVAKGYIRKIEIGSSKGHATTYLLLDLSLVPTGKEDLPVNGVNQSIGLTSKGDLPVTSKGDLPQLVNEVNSNNTHVTKLINNKTHIEKESVFFENSPLEQKKENPSDLSKPEDPKTPPIAPPAAPPFFDDPMGDRFRDGGNKPKQVKAWQENDLFVRFIHKDLAQKSEYYKNQPYESAKHYIGKSRLSSPDMVLRFEELTDHYQNFLKSQAQRSQQPAPQVAPIELIVTAPVPSNVREFAAKLARKSS